jgi:hypothetical protein
MVFSSSTLRAGVAGTLLDRRASPGSRCPICGSFLDAPRVNRVTRKLGRKCSVCDEWHPLEGRRLPDRAE